MFNISKMTKYNIKNNFILWNKNSMNLITKIKKMYQIILDVTKVPRIFIVCITMSTLWFERLTFMTELIQDFASCLTWRPNQAKPPAPAMLCWPPKATVVLQVSYDLARRAQWDVAIAINNYPRLLVVPFDLPVIKYTTVTYESLGSLSKWLWLVLLRLPEVKLSKNKSLSMSVVPIQP